MRRPSINYFASKGYQVAFSKKSNALKYQRLLKSNGFNSGFMRSWGPTIDSRNKRSKSYYVIPEKMGKKSKVARRMARMRRARKRR